MATRFGLLLTLATCVASAKHDPVERVRSAQTVLEEIMSSTKDTIPRDLLEKAHCMVIVPSLKRGAFIVGAQYGAGVATCRKAGGVGWTGPSIVRMEGGSFGFQIGAGETDVVLVVNNKAGADKLMRSEFTLGAEGAVMAGPVGRAASAETDAYMRAEILSYSRSRGVFAGVALKGSTLRADHEANAELYGKGVTHQDILKGEVASPASASGLIQMLNKYSRIEEKTGSRELPVGVRIVTAAYEPPQHRPEGRPTGRLEKEVRHELVMLPYYGVFDNLAFRVDGATVTLLGQVTRPTLKSDAGRVVKDIEGVQNVKNEIEVLPVSPNDERVRMAVYRAIYGDTALNRYGLQAVPSIHIIVKNGNVALEGVVANEGDRNIANIRANGVSGVFGVTNNLAVEGHTNSRKS